MILPSGTSIPLLEFLSLVLAYSSFFVLFPPRLDVQLKLNISEVVYGDRCRKQVVKWRATLAIGRWSTLSLRPAFFLSDRDRLGTRQKLMTPTVTNATHTLLLILAPRKPTKEGILIEKQVENGSYDVYSQKEFALFR